MNANVIYDFDDVISIVNERHEHCRFHESIKKERKKEMERLHKERMHDFNRGILHWLSNGCYCLTGGLFTMSIAFAALNQFTISAMVCCGSVASAALALYFEKKEQQF